MLFPCFWQLHSFLRHSDNLLLLQVTMDPQWQQKIEQDIKEAQDTALPEDDEDL